MTLAIPAEAYFPTCLLPACTTVGEHSHVLPHQQDIFDFGLIDPVYQPLRCHLITQGGVGSAKSIAYAARSVREMLEVPDNVGIVARKDYKILFKTSWLDVTKCIKKLVRLGYLDALWYVPKKAFQDKRKEGGYATIEFHNGSILYAIQEKNWSEALGPSYGMAWTDDAMETSEEFFIGDGANAGLISRLRLPEARFYRDIFHTPINRIINLVSTNPPPIGHWLHRLFGKTPGYHTLGDDIVKVLQVASTDNPFTGKAYVSSLVAVQVKMGKGKESIDRIIYGKSIPAYGGVKVFPQFQHELHVGSFTFNPLLPLIRSWDFGFHHPAVVFSNLRRCEYGENHMITLSEVADQFSIYIGDFYTLHVQPHTEAHYETAIIYDCGDKAGDRLSDSNKDRRGPIKILRADYNLDFRVKYTHVTPSIEYMQKLLTSTCACGSPLVLINNTCEMLIGALEGGYRYPKPRGGVVGDKPYEDKLFADVACAWRYGAENYQKTGVPHTPTEERYIPKPEPKPWDWMELTDKELAKLLTPS